MSEEHQSTLAENHSGAQSAPEIGPPSVMCPSTACIYPVHDELRRLAVVAASMNQKLLSQGIKAELRMLCQNGRAVKRAALATSALGFGFLSSLITFACTPLRASR